MLQNPTTRRAAIGGGGFLLLALIILFAVMATLVIKNDTSISFSAPAPSIGSSSARQDIPTVASDIEYAEPIPGYGITLGTYNRPGKPGEMTDGGQIAASAILFATQGRTEEAENLIDPVFLEKFKRQFKALQKIYDGKLTEGIEIQYLRKASSGGMLKYPIEGTPTGQIWYQDIIDVSTGYPLHLGDDENLDLQGFWIVPEKKSNVSPVGSENPWRLR